MSDPRDQAGNTPLHTPYDPNYPTGGGNFNPDVKIDTSHVSVAAPFKPGDNVGPIVAVPRRHPGPEAPPPPNPGPEAPPSGPVVTLQFRSGTNGHAAHQFRTAADAWIRGVPWWSIDPATHNDAVKRVLESMAGRYGIVITSWRNA
jgi:hypothetical protein